MCENRQFNCQVAKGKNLTKRNIADALGIQNKTVSKWECGLGCPDLSLRPELSAILGVDMKQMMEGEITSNKPDSGNIDKVRFYVCSSCGNILVSTGSASIFCCGRKIRTYLAYCYNYCTKNHGRGNRY